jgi:hypothetical protein
VNKFINIYLKILPILGLVGIVLGALRTAYESTATVYILIFTAVIDLFIVLLGREFINRPVIYLVGLLLLMSVFVGLLNDNELSRRYITDVSNPLFFFCKILIFKEYWKLADFSNYTKYYYRIGMIGSALLLPIAYLVFSTAGVNRIAIFPPLELPFAYLLQGKPLVLLFCALLILLYGKRTQLAGALATFIVFIFLFRKNQFFKYLAISIVGVILLVVVFDEFKDNNAIRKLNYTYDLFMEAENLTDGLASASSGRDDEIASVIGLMKDDMDYVFGLGIGFTYDMNEYSDRNVSNVHFSPLGFISKYGIIFTVFIYWYLLKIFFSFNKKYISSIYIVAYSTFVFIFVESFFSYSLFVTPLAAVVIGYIESVKQSINE